MPNIYERKRQDPIRCRNHHFIDDRTFLHHICRTLKERCTPLQISSNGSFIQGRVSKMIFPDLWRIVRAPMGEALLRCPPLYLPQIWCAHHAPSSINTFALHLQPRLSPCCLTKIQKNRVPRFATATLRPRCLLYSMIPCQAMPLPWICLL